jgi:hypothetical protein
MAHSSLWEQTNLVGRKIKALPLLAEGLSYALRPRENSLSPMI